MDAQDSISARILGQITLIQSMVVHLPDKENVMIFVCEGLRELPGVNKIDYCIFEDGVDKNKSTSSPQNQNRRHLFKIKFKDYEHGDMSVYLSDVKSFSPYVPFIENLINMLAVIFEERRQRSLNKSIQADLEKQAYERTKKLEVEIKERKQAEERFEAIYENAPVLIDAFDENGQCVLWNNECQKTFGWTMDQINAHGDALSLFYLDSAIREEVIRSVTTDPGEHFREWHPITKDGKILDTMWANLKLPDGLTFNLGYDITDRNLREEALRESEYKFKTLITETEEIVFMISKDGTFLLSEGKGLGKIGLKPGQVVGKSVFKIYKDYPVMLGAMEKAFEGTAIKTEIQLEGNHFRSWYTPHINQKGEVIGLMGLSVNITEQKLAEEKIKASLKEKEILLHEIHHRVKNNMQVINSLLKLQSDNIEDKNVKRVLRDSQNRVYAMSAVHETLHGSEILSEIDLRSYLFKVTTSIFQTYSTDHHMVKLNSNIDESPISINQAYPLGLVINELISNSLKYAFQKDTEGEINVDLKKLDNNLELIVMDNGTGMPEGLDWKNSGTLGLKLVQTLVENQLDGSIDMESNHGTKFTIKFNIET